MPIILPQEVYQLFTQQSLAALPATNSGMTPIGAVMDALTVPVPAETDDDPITDDTRFSLTPKGEAALAACKSVPAPRVRPACPLCGSDVWKVYDRMGFYEECENTSCYYVGEASAACEVVESECDYERRVA